jgi:multidrug efflux pump subunit AcrA (membrane-fusion protein)
MILLLILFAAGAGWFGLIPDRAASPKAVAASPAAGGAPAMPVTEGRAETRDVPIWLSGIGTVQPLNTVTVKVRVDGQLDRVAFTEGQDVHKGDVLARATLALAASQPRARSASRFANGTSGGGARRARLASHRRRRASRIAPAAPSNAQGFKMKNAGGRTSRV